MHTRAEIIDPPMEIETEGSQETGMDMEMDTEEMIDMQIGQAIGKIIIDRIMVIQDSGIEAKVKTMIGLGQDIGVIPGID